MALPIDTEKLARNATLAAVARIGMIAATAALPIAGLLAKTWLDRVIATGDRLVESVDKLNVSQKLLQQELKFGLDATRAEIITIKSQVTDHEGRIRVIERAIPASTIAR